MSRPFPPTVVTANDLRTGSVVYLGARGRWTDDLARARVAASAEALDELERAAHAALRRDEVVSVYAMDVSVRDGVPRPNSVREAIRAAHAPTI